MIGIAMVSKRDFDNMTYTVPGDLKKYSCFIKRKMHNKRVIFKIETCLDYQCANLEFDTLVLIVIWLRYK